MGKNFVDKLKDYRLVMLLAFVLVTFFANISVLPTDIMESRNIVTGREMVSDGNWLVPTMNGELRLEKPPLPTWVAGLMEMIAPGSMTAQRCAAARNVNLHLQDADLPDAVSDFLPVAFLRMQLPVFLYCFLI